MRRAQRSGSAFVAALAALIAAVTLRKFLLLRAVYLYKDVGNDSVNDVYPRLLLLSRTLLSGRLPNWSFEVGLGKDLYPFSLGDPFRWPLLSLGPQRLAYGLAYAEGAKLALAAALFHQYLRARAVASYAAIIGGLLYGFSAYAVLGSCWGALSTEAVYAALLLWGLERALARRGLALVAAAAGLIAALQPTFLLPYGLLLAVYGSARFIEERGFSPRPLAAFVGQLAAGSALGVLAASAWALPEIRAIALSPRVNANGLSYYRLLSAQPVWRWASAKQLTTAVLRFFSSDLLGTGSQYQGWVNYLEAPLFYCGLATLLLAPLAFASMSRRQRLIHGSMAAAGALVVVFPYFRYLLWGFSGDYYRSYALFAAALMIALAASALDRIERTRAVPRLPLIFCLGLLLAVLFGASSLAPVDASLRTVVAVLLVAHAGLIHLLGTRDAGFARRALLVLVCVEAAAFANVTVNQRAFVTTEELSLRLGYNDRTREAIVYLKSLDRDFFRVEKDYPSSPAWFAGFNDAMAQDFYGTGEYGSMTQPSYAAFAADLGVIDTGRDLTARYLPGLGARPKLMALAGVKYLLSKRPYPARKLASFEDIGVYALDGALPLGATFGRRMKRVDFEALAPDEKDAALLESVVVEPRDEDVFSNLEPGPREPLALEAFSENRLRGRVKAAGRRALFFSIPYDSGWSALVDGSAAELRRVDVGFMALALPPGAHEVELDFTPPLRAAGALFSLAGLALCLWALPLIRGSLVSTIASDS